MRDEDPGSLTLAEALNVFAGAPSAMEGLALNLAASTATSLMKLELPNPIPALEEFFAKDDLYSERMVELVLQPLLNESSSDMNDEAQRERYAGNARAFPAHFLKNNTIQLQSVESSFPSSWIEGEGERTIARAVASRIRSPETVQRLLQSSLIAEGTTDEREKEIRQALQEQLTSGKLSLRDAFQIFYLMETGGVSNTLLFFKTAKLLDANGHHDFAVNRYHAVADRLYQAASEGPEALEALFAELHLTPEQKRELENVAFYAAEYASIAGQSMMDHVREFSSRHPFVATALGIGVVLPAAYTGYRFYDQAHILGLRQNPVDAD